MKKSAFLSDVFFAFFTVGIFTLCLFRYLGLRLVVALLLAAICGVLAAGGVGSLLQSKRKSFFLKKSDEAQKQRLLTHLALLSDERKTQFFLKALSDETSFAKRFGRLRLYTQEAFYFLSFRFAPLSADEVANAARLKTAKRKIFLCAQTDEEALRLSKQLGVEIVTGEAVYSMVKSREALPETYLCDEKKEEKRKRRLHACFAKANGKRFLVGGVLILLTSLLTPFPYYYLVFGSLLLVAAVLIRIFGYS